MFELFNSVVLTRVEETNDSWFLRFDLDLLFEMAFIWFNVAVIILILAKLLYKPVRTFLVNRRERIAAELEKAAADMKDAEEKRSLYESKLAGAAGEREEILEAARKTASEREAKIIENANGEARLIMDRARNEIEREKEKAKDEMRTQIIQVSAMMAEQLLGGGMDEDKKDKILNEAIAELGDAVWKG